MAKILLIEDDETLASFLKDQLSKNNHAVDLVHNGADGLYWLSNGDYSLAVVDWDLPKLTGVDLCHQYRKCGGTVPILMLTGKSSSSEIVQGLDSGADDYLAKPFEMSPLLARIRALLRRPTPLKGSTISGGGLELDTNNCIVKVKGTPVELSPKEFAVLEMLMKNINNLCSTESILNYVWNSDASASRESVRCVINRLRSKLDAVGVDNAGKIHSVYGMGYRFES